MTDHAMGVYAQSSSRRGLSRRAVLTGAAGAAATLANTHLAGSQEATLTAGRPTTFVLLPGAWSGGWIWRKVVPLLRSAGHDALAPTPTGLGDRVHLADPAIDLDTHVTDVVNALAFGDLTGVTLVGHSYGGMVITGVAERVPERLAQLVYLDAAVPADGQDFYAISAPSPEARHEALVGDLAAGLDAGVPGFLPPDVAADWIREQTPDPADQDWLFTKFVPHPLATWTQSLRLGNPAAAALPRTYVFCTKGKGDAATDDSVRAAERARTDPAWRYLELEDTHMVIVNDPEATAQALLSLV